MDYNEVAWWAWESGTYGDMTIDNNNCNHKNNDNTARTTYRHRKVQTDFHSNNLGQMFCFYFIFHLKIICFLLQMKNNYVFCPPLVHWGIFFFSHIIESVKWFNDWCWKSKFNPLRIAKFAMNNSCKLPQSIHIALTPSRLLILPVYSSL